MTEAESMLPTHLVRYVDEKMVVHTAQVERILREHVAEDHLQLGAIQKSLTDLSALVAGQHTTVMAHWSAHELRTSAIERAFLEDHKGRPDYSGHYGEHDAGKQYRTMREKFRNTLIAGVLGTLAVAFSMWTGFVLWKAFLVGPTP